MYNQNPFITSKEMIKEAVSEVLNEVLLGKKPKQPDFEEDKINRHQASVLIGVSVTTLDKFIKAGKIKQYSTGGRKKFLFRSEVIESLRNMDK